MGVSGGAVGLSFLAGILTTLSPCVLPLIPLVIGGALTAHRMGLVALALGLVISYVVVGMFVVTVGFSIGLDGDLFRTIAGVVLIAFGVVLVSPHLQSHFARATASVGNSGHVMMSRVKGNGLHGQLLLGLLLGAVWSPCVGPTLGAAAMMASQRKNLSEAAIIMVTFGIGAVVPLLILGAASREIWLRWRGRMMRAGKMGKAVLGILAIVIGLAAATGYDRDLETVLVNASPDWLTDLTTRY